MNLLGYLNDHLAGAAAGIQLAERCRDRDPESELGQMLQVLLLEIRHDRGVLERVISVLGGSPDTIKRGAALGAERVSSLRMWLPMIGPGTRAVGAARGDRGPQPRHRGQAAAVGRARAAVVGGRAAGRLRVPGPQTPGEVAAGSPGALPAPARRGSPGSAEGGSDAGDRLTDTRLGRRDRAPDARWRGTLVSSGVHQPPFDRRRREQLLPNERVSRDQSFRFLSRIGLEADEAA
jgi:hypothetical protein